MRGEILEVPDSFVENFKDLPPDIDIVTGERKKLTSWFEQLKKINGIGIETAKDIGRIYKTKDELIDALKRIEVPLRNDKVELLKKHYGVD